MRGLPKQTSAVRLYRDEQVETIEGSVALVKDRFPDGTYTDVPGLCRVATLAEIEAQGLSLNPGRYTGTAAVENDDENFMEKLAGLHDEFTRLSDEADVLRPRSTLLCWGSWAYERHSNRPIGFGRADSYGYVAER